MSDTYYEEDKITDSGLVAEYDTMFDGDEKANNLLKLTSDAFTREFRTIKIKEIGFTDPVKKGRQNTMSGLTATIRDLGVLTPIHVMTVDDSSADDDYKYVCLEGLRRIFGAVKNGQEEIDAIVWDFKDKDKGMDVALYLTLLLSRTQRRSWKEIWDLYQILELQSPITPGTLEHLLQLEPGDAMKLKDIMLSSYDEVKELLFENKKTLDACYKMLAKLRKEEDMLAVEDATGVDESLEGTEGLASNNQNDQLSDQDVMELLEMADNLDDLNDVTDDDFKELSSSEYEAEQQKVGERHPIDPALRQAVLARDNFICQCCGMRMVGARLGLIAVHHVLPVHTGGRDTLDNMITLCLNDHIALHIMERNGGSILMSKEDYEALGDNEKISLKKARKLALVAIEADKRRGLSREDVAEATLNSIKHPMPGAGLKENQTAFSIANGVVQEHSVEPQSVPEPTEEAVNDEEDEFESEDFESEDFEEVEEDTETDDFDESDIDDFSDFE